MGDHRHSGSNCAGLFLVQTLYTEQTIDDIMGGEQLKVVYADGSSRIINLSPEFFKNTEVYSSLLKKKVVIGSAEKAKQLAELYGRRPLTVVLTQGGNVVFKKEAEWTEQGQPRVEKVARGVIKKLRRAHKDGFTVQLNSFRLLATLELGLSA